MPIGGGVFCSLAPGHACRTSRFKCLDEHYIITWQKTSVYTYTGWKRTRRGFSLKYIDTAGQVSSLLLDLSPGKQKLAREIRKINKTAHYVVRVSDLNNKELPLDKMTAL